MLGPGSPPPPHCRCETNSLPRRAKCASMRIQPKPRPAQRPRWTWGDGQGGQGRSSRRGAHQNEAISSNKVVHMASVPTAMNSDCGVVGSCSSSDMTEALCCWNGERRRTERLQADQVSAQPARWLYGPLVFFTELPRRLRACERALPKAMNPVDHGIALFKLSRIAARAL